MEETVEMTPSEKLPTSRYSRNSKHPDGQCGCGPRWAPPFLQWLRWPALIMAYLTMISLVRTLSGSYSGSVLSTIERRFGLSSSQSAFVASVDSLSSTFVVVFVGFLADRFSRPVLLTCALVLMGIGNLMTAMPHFLSDPLDPGAILDGKITTTTTEWVFLASLIISLCKIYIYW